MNTFIFLILTYIMGFLAAIPVGATQIEIAKRSLNSRLKQAYMVVAGSVCSDVMYGFIAVFGLAPFLKEKLVISIFELAATLLLWLLAFLTFRDGKADQLDLNKISLKSKRLSFVTGFSLAVTNPMMIFWWLVGISILNNFGIAPSFDFRTSLLYLLFGGIGIASYLSILTYVLHWAKKFISERLMKKINLGMGVVLLLLSFYFLVDSLRVLLY